MIKNLVLFSFLAAMMAIMTIVIAIPASAAPLVPTGKVVPMVEVSTRGWTYVETFWSWKSMRQERVGFWLQKSTGRVYLTSHSVVNIHCGGKVKCDPYNRMQWLNVKECRGGCPVPDVPGGLTVYSRTNGTAFVTFEGDWHLPH